MVDYTAPSIPPGFKQKLRAIDKDLYPKWNAKRRQWEIWWKRPFREDVCVVLVGGIDKWGRRIFQPLDDRVIETLRKGDLYNIGPKAFMRMIEEEERKALEAQERERAEQRKAVAEDMAEHLKLVQKPIGVPTEKEYQKPKGKIVDSTSLSSDSC